VIERNPTETIWQRYDRALSRVGDGDLAGAAGDIQFILDELRRQESEAEELRYYRSKHALLYMIGLIRVQQRDLSGAREAFGEAMVENAGFAHAQAALGLLSRTERNMRQALEEHTAAAALMPNDPVIQLQHAQALFDAGRFDAAVEVAQRVASAEPIWAAPHLIMGRARERQRRNTEALGHFRAYVSRARRADPNAQALRPRLDAQTP
jgi:predicted Zn-dependent protease